MADAAHKGRKLTVETSIQDQILYTRTYLESETFQLILFFKKYFSNKRVVLGLVERDEFDGGFGLCEGGR